MNKKIISVVTILGLIAIAALIIFMVIFRNANNNGAPDRMRDNFPGVSNTSVFDKNVIHKSTAAVGNWRYQYAKADSNEYHDFDAFFFSPTFSDLPWQYTQESNLTKIDGADGYDFLGEYPVLSNQRAWLNNVYDSVYTYTAPLDGVIDISFPEGAKIYGDPNLKGDGVKLVVYKKTGDKYIPIGPASQGAGIYTAETTEDGGYEKVYQLEMFTTAIKAGETLHFQISKNKSANGYHVMWDPCVTYQSKSYDGKLDLGITMDKPLIQTYAFHETFENYTDPSAGTNGWLYQSYTNGKYETLKDEINLSADEKFWTNGELWGGQPAISNWAMNPGPNGAATATYTAPEDGVVELSAFGVFGDLPEASTGVSVAIFQNDIKIWPADSNAFIAKPAETYDFIPLEIAIKKGDKLHFTVDVLGSPDFASFKWDPSVTYLSYTYDPSKRLTETANQEQIKTFDYSEQFDTTTQGPLWRYLSVPAGGTTYAQLKYVDFDWGGAWASENVDFSIGYITINEMLPGFNHDAVIAFKAPYTGKITIQSKSGIVDLQSSPDEAIVPGDGIDFGVFLRSGGELQKLYPQDAGTSYSGMQYLAPGESKEFPSITLDIKKNEVIWFRANNGPNGRNDHDSVRFTPVIEYLNVDTNDPGVPDEDTAGLQRTDRPAGSNLQQDAFPCVGRNFSDAAEKTMDAKDIIPGIEAGTLARGVYIIGNNDTFVISDKKDRTYDFEGYKFIVTPQGGEFNPLSEKRFGLFIAACENVTVKNLTLEINGTPNVAVHSWDSKNIHIENLEITENVQKECLLATFEGSDSWKGDFIIDGLRFISNTGKINKLLLGNKVANATIKNSYVEGLTFEDQTSKGAWIENNIIKNTAQVGIGLASNATAIYNTMTTKDAAGIYAADRINVLAALNSIGGSTSIDFHAVTNGVALLNELDGLSAVDCTNITLAENTFADHAAVKFNSVNYALGTGNKNFDKNINLEIVHSTNLSGEDFNDDIVPKLGANEELLPKLNRELFVGMERKTAVEVGSGNSSPLNAYIPSKYNTSKYIILPPGAYSVAHAINLTAFKDFKIYAYGVLAEFNNTAAVQMTECEDIAIKGLYVDYLVPPNGQAVITSVSNNTITFKMDAGYNQDLLDSSDYALNNGTSANIEWFKKGEKIVSNIATAAVSKAGSESGVFSIEKKNFRDAQVGDKLGFRGRDQQVTYLYKCSGIRFEDYTLYGGGGFGFMEREGNKATLLNRMAVVPGPAPMLSDGSRGEARLLSTCDSTHSTNMRNGPQITNCLFESATDDGTNINAEFGTVKMFDSSTKTITYARGDNKYSGMCVDFKKGDRVLVYTKKGELLCDAVAASDTVANGDTRSVRIESGDFEIKFGTILQNASASGNNFSIKNTKLYGNWTKGFLIKAIGGEISNCTFDSVGITAIYLCPEIKDGLWNECGYAEDILIKNNLIQRTGYMYSDDIYSTVINIRSDAAVTNNPSFMMMKNITVTGNKVEGRHAKYALNINGGNNISVENNDWGYMSGKDASNDTQTSAIITTSKDIKMSGNTYPSLAKPKMNISTSSTINIYGDDISAS